MLNQPYITVIVVKRGILKICNKYNLFVNSENATFPTKYVSEK